MTWTWGLAVQIVAGFLGAHAAANAAPDSRFGLGGHSLAGLIGGALSGFFLQLPAITIVTGGGSQNPTTIAEVAVINVLSGAAAGAILMFAVGFFNQALRHRE